MPDFLSAVAQRQIQGVIVGIANREEMEWLGRLEIPLTIFASNATPSRVDMDEPRMMRDALAELKRQGCRSVGMLYPWAVSDLPSADGEF